MKKKPELIELLNRFADSADRGGMKQHALSKEQLDAIQARARAARLAQAKERQMQISRLAESVAKPIRLKNAPPATIPKQSPSPKSGSLRSKLEKLVPIERKPTTQSAGIQTDERSELKKSLHQISNPSIQQLLASKHPNLRPRSHGKGRRFVKKEPPKTTTGKPTIWASKKGK